MLVTHDGNWFWAHTEYSDRERVKSAGFLWDPALRRWKTKFPARAALLRAYCDDSALLALTAHFAKLEASRATDSAIDVPCPEGLAYLPYQKAGIAYAVGRPATLIADEMGLGKEQPVDAPVLTPTGWRRIGDLHVGHNIIGSDGRATRVKGVYPQGIKPSFCVTFSDGSSVEAGAEHLWTVYYRRGGRRWQELTLTTEQLRTRPIITMNWAAEKNHREETDLDLSKTVLYLPMLSKPVKFEREPLPLPLPAYLVGQLIANGCMLGTTPQLTSHAADWETIKNVLTVAGVNIGQTRTIGLAHQALIKGIAETTRELGLDMYSAEKRIPLVYLRSAISNRILLLQGLMDGDGSVSKTRNRLTYHTTSEGLACDVQDLVEQLGGIASIRTYDRSAEAKPTEYQVRMRLPTGIMPFRVPRKVERYVPGRNALPCRTVTSVKYTRDVKSVCIAVEAEDRLYATAHCILTHNTVQALGVINATARIRLVLVVCPTSLRLNWQREAQKWLTRKLDIHVVTTKTRVRDIPLFDDLVITNYESMVKHETELAKVEWDLVILDEAHYVKNPKAQRSQAAYRLAGAAKQRLLLTGTPILNRPVELQPLAGLCDPDRFGDPRIKRTLQCWSFLRRYCGAHQEQRGRKLVWVFDGATHLDELQERLRASCMVRRLKADVLGELPPKRRQVVHVEGTEEDVVGARHLAAVEAAEAELALARAESDAVAYKVAAAKLRYLNEVAFTEMSEYRHRLGLAKVDRGVEYVRELIEGGVDKVIVFGHHRDVLEQARDAFNTQTKVTNWGKDLAMTPGESAAVIVWGGMKDEDRQAAVDRFQNDPTCKIFVGQIQAAGVGLTLTAASHVVFVELDWVPANTTQAEDRAHRIGQRGVVNVHHLVIDGTLDAHMVHKVVEKQEIADQALDLLPDFEGEAGSLARVPTPPTATRKVPESRRQAALAGLRFLARRCDGAQQEDGAGFNKLDTDFGKKLAALSDLSDAQFYAAFKLLRKYSKRQLPASVVSEIGFENESRERKVA